MLWTQKLSGGTQAAKLWELISENFNFNNDIIFEFYS
jgi:hypothetical protein